LPKQFNVKEQNEEIGWTYKRNGKEIWGEGGDELKERKIGDEG
jgi:hypothetical protein